MNRPLMNLWMVTIHRRAYMQSRKVHRQRIRDMSNPFQLNEIEFRSLFRISREIARDICLELDEELKPKKTFGITVQIKVLTAIRLLAVGSYQRGTGQDYLLVLGQTTVFKVLRQFLDIFLEKFLHRFIKFPATYSSRLEVSAGFEQKFGFPNILGCIDCTHVAITTPYLNAESFKCHHDYYSLNVQLICDVNGKLLNVNARYPGRTHDQFIFNNSVIKEELIRLYENRIGDYHLIGDSGYALEPWMMTPILSTIQDSPQERYTKLLCQVRNIIERVNGIVKATFRSIKRERVLRYQPLVANKIVNCCCTLYNMMLHYRVPFPEPDYDSNDDDNNISIPVDPGRLLNVARSKRESLVNQLFN